MDINSLITIGLSPQQAEAYALLIEHGELRPAQAAKDLNLTRTNA
jgi:sugar-specific transcriptional regulator TrmB